MTDQGKALALMATRIAAGISANPANTGLPASHIAVQAWDVAQCIYQLGEMHRDIDLANAGKSMQAALSTATQ